MEALNLSIVIVNWNSSDFVRRCISSIYSRKLGISYEIIVVDSGSFDGCDRMLQEFFPKVHFIQINNNVGFARANNLGAGSARGTTLLFLNPDTEVCRNAISDLFAYVNEHADVGVVGCRLLNCDGSLQTSCVQPIPTILNQVMDVAILQQWFPNVGLWRSALSFEGAIAPVPVEAVSGACMMIRREVFDHVGGFSTDYFMYSEDLDLCWKVRAAGFRNYYLPGPKIVHYGGGSTACARSRFSFVMVPESVSRLLRKMRGKNYSIAYQLALSASAVVRMSILVLGFPFALVKCRTREWHAVFGKWLSVLRWGCGLEKWTKKYGLD